MDAFDQYLAQFKDTTREVQLCREHRLPLITNLNDGTRGCRKCWGDGATETVGDDA